MGEAVGELSPDYDLGQRMRDPNSRHRRMEPCREKLGFRRRSLLNRRHLQQTVGGCHFRPPAGSSNGIDPFQSFVQSGLPAAMNRSKSDSTTTGKVPARLNSSSVAREIRRYSKERFGLSAHAYQQGLWSVAAGIEAIKSSGAHTVLPRQR